MLIVRRDGELMGAERLARQVPAKREVFRREGTRDAIHAAIGVVDQGVTALGSLIPVVLLGRMAGAHDLGIFSLAVSVALFAAIASQSLFVSGYPIFRAQAPGESRAFTAYAALFGLAAQLALLPIYFAILHWTSPELSAGTFVVVAFVATTAMRSHLRTLSLARRDMPGILALDTSAFAILSALLTWLALRGSVTVWNVFAVLAVANAFFSVAWGVGYAKNTTFRWDGAGEYFARSVAFGRWALAGVGVGSAPYYLTPWLLALVRGTTETAVYAAASTVVGLANHALIGLTRGIEARTAEAFQRGGVKALEESIVRSAWIILPALAVVVAVIWGAADFFGELVLPSAAQEAGSAARILSVALLVGSIRVIAGNGLWAMNLPRATFPADVVRGIVSIGLGIAGAYYAGAVGCAVAVLLGDVISSLMVVARLRAEIRRRSV